MALHWKTRFIIFFATFFVIAGIGVFALTYPDTVSELVGSLTPVTQPLEIDPHADLRPQQPLSDPPHPIKAIYLTAWAAGSATAVDRAIALIDSTELNAVVIDIKDYTGMVSYKPDLASVVEYGAYEKRIKRINALLKQFHDAGIYVIARIAVFQDPQLVKARPEFALQSIEKKQPWADHKGLTWLDAAAPAVWDYNIDIAKDALQRGFDEVNFDYIRFPTDGKVSDISFPYFKPETQTKREVIRSFLKHVREELPFAKISVDIFGETTVMFQESGIGQHLEDPFLYVDAVAPMIYPSHFANGFLGYQNPAQYPGEIILYSMNSALARLKKFEQSLFTSSSSTPVLADGRVQEVVPPALAQLRPWLQDFNLGATYDGPKVRAQIDAVQKAAYRAAGCDPATTDCSAHEIGWMLWSAGNGYNTKAALLNQ